MAAPAAELEKFAQSVYLTIKNRYFDDIAGADGQVFIAQIIDWANMFVDELEFQNDVDGQPVDWWFTREAGFELGTANEGEASVSVPSTLGRLITDEQRYVQIQQGGTTISNWAVVHPKDISSKTERITEDMCAVVGSNLVFSRAFLDTENAGTIIGDVTTKLPLLSSVNVKLLTTVRPKQLLILGVAKNATLPDIVQGKLSPNYAQKYTELLQGAVSRSKASSVAARTTRDSYGSVRGLY